MRVYFCLAATISNGTKTCLSLVWLSSSIACRVNLGTNLDSFLNGQFITENSPKPPGFLYDFLQLIRRVHSFNFYLFNPRPLLLHWGWDWQVKLRLPNIRLMSNKEHHKACRPCSWKIFQPALLHMTGRLEGTCSSHWTWPTPRQCHFESNPWKSSGSKNNMQACSFS